VREAAAGDESSNQVRLGAVMKRRYERSVSSRGDDLKPNTISHDEGNVDATCLPGVFA
jgi:hypothetical protein